MKYTEALRGKWTHYSICAINEISTNNNSCSSCVLEFLFKVIQSQGEKTRKTFKCIQVMYLYVTVPSVHENVSKI